MKLKFSKTEEIDKITFDLEEISQIVSDDWVNKLIVDTLIKKFSKIPQNEQIKGVNDEESIVEMSLKY